jgi:DNA repair protein RecO
MYTLHTTPALVFKTYTRGEADKLFHIYTRDFGRIEASAKGIRLLKSKLRYALQTHSLSLVSLVKGKSEWRVVNAIPKKHPIKQGGKLRQAKLHLLSLIERLIQGELRDPLFFDFIQEVLTFAEEDAEPADLYLFAAIFALERLGYVSLEAEVRSLYENPLTSEVLRTFRELVPDASKRVKEALQRSHL